MLALPDRPLIRLEEIASHLHTSIGRLHKLCAEATPLPIPITMHPTFGELLSPASTRRLIDLVIVTHTHGRSDPPPICHDRISLLLWMCGLHGRKRQTYSDSVEAEVKRISKLRDPERTMRALDLLSRFVDARMTAEAVLRLKRLPNTKIPRVAEAAEARLSHLASGGALGL
jgi:hypothetical protein